MEIQPKLTSAKDILAIVRETALIITVLVILIYPGSIAWWAKTLDDEGKKRGAKSTEVSIAGAKVVFDDATNTVANLAAADRTNDDLRQHVQTLVVTSSPKNAEQVKQIETASNVLSSQLKSSLASAKSTQLAQDQIVQGATGLKTGEGNYGIVVSADKKDDLAAYEVHLLKKENINDVAIYDRQGFLRTLARFPDAAAANAVLPDIQKTRQGAYVINLSKWCPQYSSERTLADVPVLKCD
jgi:hypothetical protein